MGQDCTIWTDWIKCSSPCQSTRSSNLYSNELSKNGYHSLGSDSLKIPKTIERKAPKERKKREPKSLKELSTPPKDSGVSVSLSNSESISMWHNALTPITNRDMHLPENRSRNTERNDFCESIPWFKGWKVNKTLAILGWLISYLSTLKRAILNDDYFKNTSL